MIMPRSHPWKSKASANGELFCSISSPPSLPGGGCSDAHVLLMSRGAQCMENARQEAHLLDVISLSILFKIQCNTEWTKFNQKWGGGGEPTS